MPITSFFLPSEGLQGEDIPSHIIWKDIDYSHIQIRAEPPLKLKELYNVSERDWREESGYIIIERLEVEGYLGMLFATSLVKKEACDVSVSFSFINSEEQTIEHIRGSIHLFRPKIVTESIPEIIKVDLQKKFVENRIQVRNIGEGTAIITFKTTKDSELKKKLPLNILEFRKQFYEDLQRNLSRVKKEFPQYSIQITQYLDVLKKPYKGRKYLEKMKDALEGIIDAFMSNEDFGWAFIEALGAAYLKNVRLVTIFEDFLDYLNSIASKKILLSDPLEVITVSKEMKELCLQIETTDLVLGKYPRIMLPKIKIFANGEGEIQIHRLFEWR